VHVLCLAMRTYSALIALGTANCKEHHTI
jgi:hypothetical protein